ncbi:MAG: hypothetical protein RLZZ516_1354, partial [Cyanobacteriota bacterium]
MLPGPTTLLSRAARLLRRAGALLAAALLLVGLSACTGLGQPSQRVLLSALALQIDLTQRSIADALSLSASGPPQVSRVRVESQQGLQIGANRGLHLTGR